MDKSSINRLKVISNISNIVENYSSLDYKWTSNVYEYILFIIKKWNQENDGHLILINDIGLTEEKSNILKMSYFDTKEKDKELEEQFNIKDIIKRLEKLERDVKDLQVESIEKFIEL